VYYIYRIHRDEYNTYLFSDEYGPYPTKEHAETLAAEFREEYGYECVVHTKDFSKQN